MTVISQRPAEVNRTVLSQCNNFVAMRLTNAEDQAVIRRLMPDTLGGFVELLPILDIGEALVVGDAAMLPSRIRIDEPTKRPSSATGGLLGPVGSGKMSRMELEMLSRHCENSKSSAE
ncbi:MAG: hypothetical protein U5K27_07095 [Desulfotignum sp.]|nr:hypothetical protein [Desulfotignum sp.]